MSDVVAEARMPSDDFVAEFDGFQEVLESFASKLSEEGVFLAAAPNGGVGAEIGFQVRIRDGFTVLSGQGEIVRATDEGLFLRLTYLDQPSLKLLPKLLEHYRRKGVPLLELPSHEMESVEEIDRTVAPSVPETVEPDTDLADEVDQEVLEGDTREEDEKVLPTPTLSLDDVEAEFEQQTAAEADNEEKEVLLVGDALLVEAADMEPSAVIDEGGEMAADIHFDNLLDADGDEGQLAGVVGGQSLEDGSSEEVSGDLQVDSGLSWLPDDAQEKSKKGLWVILLLVLLGAALGAAFYFFVLQPEEKQSTLPAQTDIVQTQVVPAALVKPIPDPVKTPLDGGIVLEPAIREPDNPLAVAVSGPMTGVERITWKREADATVITLWADGSFVAEQVDDFRVDDGSPREVVRIRGIRRPFPDQRIELDTAHVRRIRTGIHMEADGSALHVVADLVDGDVELLRTEATGHQLRVYFSKTG